MGSQVRRALNYCIHQPGRPASGPSGRPILIGGARPAGDACVSWIRVGVVTSRLVRSLLLVLIGLWAASASAAAPGLFITAEAGSGSSNQTLQTHGLSFEYDHVTVYRGALGLGIRHSDRLVTHYQLSSVREAPRMSSASSSIPSIRGSGTCGEPTLMCLPLPPSDCRGITHSSPWESALRPEFLVGRSLGHRRCHERP